MNKNKNFVTIREAARLTGRQEMYIRRLVIDGKIAAQKTFIGDSDIPRWEISREALEQYFANSAQRRTVRQDGRNKWVIYATKDELSKVVDLLTKHGFEEVAASIGRANKPKAKSKSKLEPEPEPEPA